MADQTFNKSCGFFDSLNSDRLYSADQMNKPYKRLISNGVFATSSGTASTDLQVVESSGMDITVKAGEGIFADKWFESSADFTVTVPNNTNVTPRIDSVIVQIDKRTSGRVGNIVYRTGTPSSSPVAPSINTVTNVVEYRVANIYVSAGATAITTANITDLRGSSECPWITSLIQQVDTSTLYNQWRAAYQKYYDDETEAFNEFMESLTEQLTVNTNIATFESHYTSSVDGETVIPINISGYNKAKDVLMVRINRLFASEGTDYTISSDSTQITLTKDITKNNNVDFIVLKSVVVGDTTTVLQQLSTMNTTLSALNSDTGWVTPTLTSTFKQYNESNNLYYRRLGKVVSIEGVISPNSNDNTLNSTNASVVFTLPEGCRPKSRIVTVCQGSSTYIFIVQIDTDGTVSLGRYRNENGYSDTPPTTSTWLPMNITFMVA